MVIKSKAPAADIPLFLLVIPLIAARGFARIDSFWLGFLPRLLSISICGLIAAANHRKLSAMFWLLLGYSVYGWMVTLLTNPGQIIHRDLLICLTTLAFCALLDVCIKQNSPRFIKTMFLAYTFLCILNYVIRFNAASALHYAEDVFLLGHRNELPVVYFFWVLISCLYFQYTRRSAKVYFHAAFWINLFIFAALKTGGALASAAVMLMILYAKPGIRCCKAILPLAFIAIFLFAFFRVQGYFSYIITSVLYRNLTLTSRIYIWDAYIDLIRRKPLYGYGYGEVYIAAIGGAAHPHNFALKLLYSGGVIAVVFFISMAFVMGGKLFQVKSRRVYVPLLTVITGLLICGISGSLDGGCQIFPAMLLGYHAPLINQYKLEIIANEDQPNDGQKMHEHP